MRFIADFHIHSHYSRATSPAMNIVSLTKWSQIKGIGLIGTGDFTHPRWFTEMRDTLESAESGLFRLASAHEKDIARDIPSSCRSPMRFVLSVEISMIYKKKDRVRKVHALLIVPSFEAAARINARLGALGNLGADGRPILGLDAKELVKIALDASPDALIIPAHIWTPHFSVFGSASGFDSLEECFDELAPEIHALESGLSSDPAMNWRVADLDGRAIVSNSDAHSPGKLGREANVFNTDLSYPAIRKALVDNDPGAFEETIEFYPEEGKYHLDGHRACGVRLDPTETRACGGVCAACGKPVTVGVMHRVEALAASSRPQGYRPAGARAFRNIIPLPEIIGEVEEVGPASKRVERAYSALIAALGNEFHILLDAPLEDIARAGGHLVAEAVRRMREGAVRIAGGYDGEYGTVSLFSAGERETLAPQTALFTA